MVSDPTLWLYRWLLENRRITEFIRMHHLNATLVTYCDLATMTESEVRRLTEWTGLEYEPSQLEYWNREHVGTEKRAYDWVKREKARYFDQRWKTELPQDIQEQICRDHLVNEYLKELGVCLTSDGITRLNGFDPYRTT